MKYREDYTRLKHVINMKVLEPHVATLIHEYGEYFEEFQKHDVVQPDVFASWFNQFRSATFGDDQRTFIIQMVHATQLDPDEEARAGIIHKLKEQEYATAVANHIQNFRDGQVPDQQTKWCVSVNPSMWGNWKR